MLIAARKRVKCLEGERNRNRIPEKKNGWRHQRKMIQKIIQNHRGGPYIYITESACVP